MHGLWEWIRKHSPRPVIKIGDRKGGWHGLFIGIKWEF